LKAGAELLIGCLTLTAVSAAAQSPRPAEVIDRVAARVNGSLVLLSDVRAAAALGIIEPGSEADQVRQMVRRQLLVSEIRRFPPQEPPAAAVEAEVARLRARVPDPARLQRDYGLAASQIDALARETLRIEAYLDQRFGANVSLSDEQTREYYTAHAAEFTRDGVLAPFESVLGEARERAAAARRRDAVAQWVTELEGRADIVLPGTTAPTVKPASGRSRAN
jgi:hypothetical protein